MIIIYARRSVEDMNSLSINIQIEQCMQKIGQTSEHIEIISDPGTSGAVPMEKRAGSSKIEQLTKEKHSLELKISKLRSSNKLETCRPSAKVISKVQGFESLSLADKRFVARTLINKIMLSSENNELVAKIHFKF